MNWNGQDPALLADGIETAAWADMYAAMPPPMAKGTGARTERHGGATLFIAPGIPQTLFNRVTGFGNGEDATDDALGRIIGTYRSAGVKKFWLHLVPGAKPPQIGKWLEARGAAMPKVKVWAKMLRDARLPEPVQTSLRLELIGPDRADLLAPVIAECHGMPPPMAAWIAAIIRRPGWTAVAVTDGGKIAGGGLLFVDGRNAWLGLGGTLPDYRRRGGQGAVMTSRIRLAIEKGCTAIETETGLIPDSPNPSLANMRRCGFEEACLRANYQFNL